MTRILIADDSADTLNILNWSLQRKGYNCSTAYYKAGLFYTMSKSLPSLIILDVNFSGEDGRLICREIKKNPETKNIPVILFSGNHELINSYSEYLADGFIAKPFELQEVVDKIESLLLTVN